MNKSFHVIGDGTDELQPQEHESLLDRILKESQRKLRKSQLNNF